MARIRPTIIDVARHAGVSKSTVSLVLRGSPLVRDSTKETVESAMAALGYVYNRAAAKLRGASAGLVGLVINDLRNPFFTEFATSAQMTFAGHGYATVVANTDEDPAIQAQVIGSMIEHGVNALLISPAYGGNAAVFDRIAQSGIPAMQVLRQVDRRTAEFPFASPDYRAGGLLAAQHLFDLGARRIAFVGGLVDRPITKERMAGYAAVAAAGDLESVVLHGRPSRGFGRNAAIWLRRERREVEAAVCFSDLVGLGMLAGLAQMGDEAGAGFRVVGFDDIEECSLVYPQLSSVRCNIKAFGEAAATTMLLWLEKGERPQESRRTQVELMARQSSLGQSVEWD